MDTYRILRELRAERDRIERAIAAIEGLDSTETQDGRSSAKGGSYPEEARPA